MISSNRIKALVSLHLDFSGKETAKIEIASDLTRYGSGRTKSAGAVPVGPADRRDRGSHQSSKTREFFGNSSASNGLSSGWSG